MPPSPSPGPERSRWARALLVLALLLFVLVGLRGIAGPWPWGHLGYNGAQYTQAARNSQRFGIVGQTPFYTGLEPPPTEALYTHHPLALHAHLVAVTAALGFEEWVPRTVPLAYGVLTLVLLFAAVRRLFDEPTAAVATLIYVLVPLDLVYAHMVDHEQGGIFWTLAFLYGYLRWDEEHRKRWLAAALVALAVGAQFDWPIYYVSFFVVVHAAAKAWRRGHPFRRWGPEHTWIALASVVTLASFGGFFLWIQSARGDVDNMGRAFVSRLGVSLFTLPRLAETEWWLHGPIPLALLLAWIVYAARLAWRGRLRRGHMIPGCFLLAQIVHCGVFGQAWRYHEYWVYYASPAIAVGGAELVLGTVRRLRARWAGDRRRLVALSLALAGLTAAQGAITWTSYARAHAVGGSLFWESYRDNYDQIAWIREVAERFPRGTARFLFHPSVRDRRMEVRFYLDAPTRATAQLPAHDDTRHVMLLDLEDPRARRLAHRDLARWRKRHRVIVFDDRFAAVDDGRPPSESVQLVSVEREPPWWWRWLVRPDHLPIEWRERERPPPWQKLLAPEREIRRAGRAGGPGGDLYRMECPGPRIDALEAQQALFPPVERTMVSAVRLKCPDGPKHDWAGEPRHEEGSTHALRCPEGATAVGLVGRSGKYLDAVGLLCEPPGGGEPVQSELVGGEGGEPFRLSCPLGSALGGVFGRGAAIIDAIGVVCVSR